MISNHPSEEIHDKKKSLIHELQSDFCFMLKVIDHYSNKSRFKPLERDSISPSTGIAACCGNKTETQSPPGKTIRSSSASQTAS